MTWIQTIKMIEHHRHSACYPHSYSINAEEKVWTFWQLANNNRMVSNKDLSHSRQHTYHMWPSLIYIWKWVHELEQNDGDVTNKYIKLCFLKLLVSSSNKTLHKSNILRTYTNILKTCAWYLSFQYSYSNKYLLCTPLLLTHLYLK